MKRTDPISVGEALTDFFEQRRLRQGVAEGAALDLWGEIVGDYVAEATEDVYIRAGVIYVHFSSPSVHVEVMTRRNFIISEFNERLGARTIRSIVVR